MTRRTRGRYSPRHRNATVPLRYQKATALDSRGGSLVGVVVRVVVRVLAGCASLELRGARPECGARPTPGPRDDPPQVGRGAVEVGLRVAEGGNQEARRTRAVEHVDDRAVRHLVGVVPRRRRHGIVGVVATGESSELIGAAPEAFDLGREGFDV